MSVEGEGEVKQKSEKRLKRDKFSQKKQAKTDVYKDALKHKIPRHKRKFTDDKKPGPNVKKAKIEQFTEIDFKVLLRDPASIFSGLEKFIEAADACSSGKGVYDIVDGYCRSSPECSEITHLLDGEKKKLPELQLIFGCLEKILLRIASDLPNYSSTGTKIVKRLLPLHGQSIFFALYNNNRSSQIKTVVKLLVAMVMQGDNAARWVLSHFDFGHSCVRPLFSRRDIKDEDDVRTCMQHFVLAFLLTGKNDIIRQTVDKRGLLLCMFEGMVYDRVATIQLVLTTVLEKVVTNPYVGQLVKTHIFNDFTLKQLGQLYTWKGPAKWKESVKAMGKRYGKKRKKDEAPVVTEGETEYRQLVDEVAHKFLLELCTSPTHGIFNSGRKAGKIESQALSGFLQFLSTVSQHTSVQSLVVNILTICPGQLTNFVLRIVQHLSPRPVPKWVDTVYFLCKIYDSLSIRSALDMIDGHKPVTEVLSTLLHHTLPPTQVLTTIFAGLKEKGLAINHVTMAVVKTIGECVTRALQAVDQSNLQTVYKAEELADVINLYKDAVIKALPNAHMLFFYWDKVLLQLTDKGSKSEMLQLKELCQADVPSVLVRIEQVLCLYQTLSPDLLVNHSFALGKLLDGIFNTELTADLTSSDSAHLPQMYLLQLLAGTDSGRLPFSKQHSSHQTLMYKLLEMVPRSRSDPRMKQVTVGLLCQLLENTGSFDSCYEELMIWTEKLQNYSCEGETGSAVLEFVAKVMLRYMGNPFPYMDKVCDLMSEVTVVETRNGDAFAGLEKQLKDILQKDITDLDDEAAKNVQDMSKETMKRFPFCPMLLVAVETLEKMENVNQDLKLYISAVLLDTFHLQVDPGPLCTLVKDFPRAVFVLDVLDYLQLWQPKAESDQPETDGEELYTVARLGEIKAGLHQGVDSGEVVVRQSLLHLSYLIMNSNTGQLKEKLHTLTETIEETVDQLLSSEDDTKSQALAGDLSMLTVRQTSGKDKAEKAVHLVLSHPNVRRFFYGEVLVEEIGVEKASKRIAHGLTKLATSMLKVVQTNKLEVGDCVEYYQTSMLDCLRSLSGLLDSNHQLKHVYHGLKHVVQGLDSQTCVTVLDSLMSHRSLSDTGELSDSFYTITDVLLKKLMTLDKSIMKIAQSSAEKLVSCYTAQKDASSSEVLVEFISKFPNLAVFFEKESLVGILESSLDARLVTFLLTHNVVLRERFEELILAGENYVEPDRHLPVTVAYLELVATEGQADKQGVLQQIVSMYKTLLLDLCGAMDGDKQELVLQVCQQLVRKHAIGDKLLKKMEKKLLATLSSVDTVQPHHVDLLLSLWEITLGDLDVAGETTKPQENRQRLLLIVVEILAKLLKKKEQGNKTTDKLLDILASFAKTEVVKSTVTADIWAKFLKYSLKHYYTDHRVLNFIEKAAPVMFGGETTDSSVTMETAVAMVMSHSSFFTVMFNEETETCKEALLDLLLLLIELSPTSCSKDHLGILLGAYGATLSTTDQKLLKLLQMYEKNGVPFIEYKPFLWGEKAIEQQQMGTMGQTLHRQPGIGHVISGLDRDTMRDTILNFPIRRNLQVHRQEYLVSAPDNCSGIETAEATGSKPHCYDPCFLLPLLSHLLSSDSVVQCKKFIESDCMSLSLAALSSHDELTRGVAYHVLDRFKLHVEGARFAEKEQILHVLDLLHNSVGKTKNRLASIAAKFLARTVKLLLKPGTHMYGVINAFLMHKPKLDVQEVPEFYKLFNSSAWEFKTERLWMLSLMQDGLREEEDFRIFEKRYIFKLLLGFYETSFADQDCQMRVLEILSCACKIGPVAVQLTDRHALLAWISSVVTQLSPDNHQQVALLIDIVASLWCSHCDQVDAGKGQKGVSGVTAGRVLTTLQSLLWKARGCPLESILLLTKTLLSVVQHAEKTAAHIYRGSDAPPTLSYLDILVLLYHADKFISSKVASSTILNVLKALNYSTSPLESPKGDHSSYQEAIDKEAEDITTETDEEKKKKRKDDEGVEVVNDSKNEVKEKEGNKREDENAFTEVLAELVLTVKPTEGAENVERTSCFVIQITWLVGQLGVSDCSLKPETVSVLETVEEMVCEEGECLVLEALVASADLATHLLTALLKTYTTVLESRHGWKSTDSCHGNEILRRVNNILVAVASRQFSESTEQRRQMFACQLAESASATEVGHQSVLLRQLFLLNGPVSQAVEKLLSQRAPRKGDNSKEAKKKPSATDILKRVKQASDEEMVGEKEVDDDSVEADSDDESGDGDDDNDDDDSDIDVSEDEGENMEVSDESD